MIWIRVAASETRVGKSMKNPRRETKINSTDEHVVGQEKRIEEGKGWEQNSPAVTVIWDLKYVSTTSTMTGLSPCTVREPITVFDRLVHGSHVCIYIYIYGHTGQDARTHNMNWLLNAFEPQTGRLSKSVSRSVEGLSYSVEWPWPRMILLLWYGLPIFTLKFEKR